MAIERIQKVNIGQEVFCQMKQMILDGEWGPGDKLPSEGELADRFGVSRITVRQALQKLGFMGLVETRLGSGSYVREADAGSTMQNLIPTAYLSASLEQVMDFREIVETGCAKLAASVATEADVEGLEEIHRRLLAARESGDAREFARQDAEFHFEIGNITRNALVIQTNHILRDVLESAMNEFIDAMGFEPAVKYHARIIDAVRRHDGDAAASLMREHLEGNKAPRK